MEATKIIGWITFLAGVLIIIFTLYYSFIIFSGKIPPPQFFKIEAKEVTSKGKIPTSPQEIQKQLGQMIAEQLKEILPVDFLPKILNLIVWSILAWILIFGGSQIASLGIKLLKQ